MAKFNKDDLQYEYEWSTVGDDDPEEIGTPDSSLLNRTEGYEMLYFINNFMSDNDLKNENSFYKIERMINEYLPSNIRSHHNIEIWLKDNWKKYK